MLIYYVYAYINKKTGLPYYIGKGKNNRAYGKHSWVSVPKDKSKIVFLECNLSEVGALALERRYIRWYGRKVNNSGILLNRGEGGEGSTGYIPTPERRKQISEQHKGNSYRKGKINSEESNKARSDTLKGRIISTDHRETIRAATKGRIHSIESIEQAKKTREKNGTVPRGEKNPMYGRRGELSPLKDHKWWTNGETSVFAKECPPGYLPGRTMQPQRILLRVPEPSI